MYVTAIHGKSYLLGLYTLAESLLTVTKHPLVVLLDKESLGFNETEEDIFASYRGCLKFITINVDFNIDNPYGARTKCGHHLCNHRYKFVMNKLWAFGLPVQGRVVFVDADIVALRSPDELFAMPMSHEIRAAADCGVHCRTERFNSGVLLIKPSNILLESMLAELGKLESQDRGDQGFLNSFFSRAWRSGEMTLDSNFNKLRRREPLGGEEFDVDNIVFLHAVGKPWRDGMKNYTEYPQTYKIFEAVLQKFLKRCDVRDVARRTFESELKYMVY